MKWAYGIICLSNCACVRACACVFVTSLNFLSKFTDQNNTQYESHVTKPTTTSTNQLDATISQVYYLTFTYSSTCFGGPHAHHQELNNCSSSLWFYRWSVVVAVLLVVVGPAGRRSKLLRGEKHNARSSKLFLYFSKTLSRNPMDSTASLKQLDFLTKGNYKKKHVV